MKRFTVVYKQALFQRSMSSQAQMQLSVKIGAMVRFQIDTGVYKPTKLLQRTSCKHQYSQLENIKILGHGGKSLPLVNNQTVAYDLLKTQFNLLVRTMAFSIIPLFAVLRNWPKIFQSRK